MKKFSLLFSITLCFVITTSVVFSQRRPTSTKKKKPGGVIKKFDQKDKFRQLEEILPTPNKFRTASGAPGSEYWQQRADYKINVELDDKKQRIVGSETITYQNNSPHTLRYLWLQLDPNIFEKNSDAVTTATASNLDRMSFRQLRTMLARQSFDGGMKITAVKDGADNSDLKHTVVKTMMRIDLNSPLGAGQSTSFKIDWNYNINDARLIRGRTGYEFFKEDGNYIYEMAQWFPRMVAYTDVTGWQHKQFLGSGEFTLEFGNYEVAITVPNDHVVGATGVLQNSKQVLTANQQERMKQAAIAKNPMYIITPAEAKANEKSKSQEKKTWVYKAKNVRDFAFATSRKFIWDAMGYNMNGKTVMAMSLFPKEGDPLWSKYSTHAIIHTLEVYSRYTFDYPYPVAYSVNGPIGGMEYPMICFNGPRPEKDGTYSKRSKYGLISVIIHEVGHNYFPMIVNTDERQWTWMDEGLNTFLQYLAEQEWEEGYPSRRGEPKDIVGYMASQKQVPIMTNSESLLQFGPNAYAKPATALNILRESVLGRELFDYAFKEYARRWKFKRPMPADFFRTMEDASGIDLDWYWRGWFYTTDHVDISIENVKHYEIATGDPDIDKPIKKKKRDSQPVTLSKKRNKKLDKRVEKYPELKDFYNKFDSLNVTKSDRGTFERFLKSLTKNERELLKTQSNFYVIDLKNIGGLVMPLILKMEYEDGTSEEVRVPAEIWRKNNLEVSKMIVSSKVVKSVTLDPNLETSDIDLENNHFPRKAVVSRFQLFKSRRFGRGGSNDMKKAQKPKKRKSKKTKTKK